MTTGRINQITIVSEQSEVLQLPKEEEQRRLDV